MMYRMFIEYYNFFIYSVYSKRHALLATDQHDESEQSSSCGCPSSRYGVVIAYTAFNPPSVHSPLIEYEKQIQFAS